MGQEQQSKTVKLESVSSAGQGETATSQCPTNKHFHFLPEGLIGTKCTAQILIDGIPITCLLDTGSQVTTIPESFYKTHLSNHHLKPLNDLLEVEGANGQAVPYLGYVNLDIPLPSDFLGTPMDVATVALVVPDLQTHQPFILVGTNTLDAVYALSNQQDFFHPVPYGYRAVLKVLQYRHKMSQESHHGVIRLHTATPQTIPARETVLLEGVAASRILKAEKAVLVEHPPSFPLPGGLMIQ